MQELGCAPKLQLHTAIGGPEAHIEKRVSGRAFGVAVVCWICCGCVHGNPPSIWVVVQRDIFLSRSMLSASILANEATTSPQEHTQRLCPAPEASLSHLHPTLTDRTQQARRRNGCWTPQQRGLPGLSAAQWPGVNHVFSLFSNYVPSSGVCCVLCPQRAPLLRLHRSHRAHGPTRATATTRKGASAWSVSASSGGVCCRPFIPSNVVSSLTSCSLLTRSRIANTSPITHHTDVLADFPRRVCSFFCFAPLSAQDSQRSDMQ